MGNQILFDADGATEGEVEDPNEQVVYRFQTAQGMEETHDQIEGFQERVEPPIIDLENALGCERSPDAISLAELFAAWPAGTYEFDGTSGGTEFEGAARLSHKIPAGPVITAPEDGAIVPHDQHLLIKWTGSLVPSSRTSGRVQILGYHIVVADTGEPTLPGAPPAQLDGDVPGSVASFTVPKQFLQPNKVYGFEVLATKKGNNQTVAEGGVFCTPPITAAECELE